MTSLILHPHESRGLLAGTVTQIRRDIKPKKEIEIESAGFTCFTPKDCISIRGLHGNGEYGESFAKMPFQPQQKIYCRETWQECPNYGLIPNHPKYHYKATESEQFKDEWPCWRSPATMPREAARIFLEVEAVSAGRVQDITEEDAVRCGVERLNETEWKAYTDIYPMGPETAKESYHTLYESIHGPGAWERNNWQWIFTVRRIDKL